MHSWKAAIVTTFFMALLARATADTGDKTLVSWVALDNTTQQGGSALTVQTGDQFDGIVFGERARGRWMAGSDYFHRTQADPSSNPQESAPPGTLVQMASVYQGNQIRLYRNGQLYASYEAPNIDLLSSAETQVVFGLRHQGAGGGDRLQGFIEEARIYNRALAQEELRGLELGKASPIRPFAWWTFDKGHEIDRMGRFPFNTLLGGARIEQGRLVLGGGTAALIATMHRPQQGSLAGPQTPAMPAHPPRSWMTYHLAHPGPGGAVPADPNCAFFWKGRYHLHYIYNHPEGCAFAHVSSTDMVHWKWHPTTLTRGFTGHGMFSGTGFLTLEGRPAIIYHGEGSGRNQIAFALDDNLERWSKPTPIEPLTASGEKPSIRHWDPDGFVKDGTYYALCGGSNPKLMKSADLKSWLYLGDLYHDRFPADLGVPREEDTSCPNLFQIGGKWMLLCISHNLGARYYLGDFVDGKYLPTHHAMLNWARWDYFAPESLLTPDGRRVIWAWCTPWVNGMQKNGRAKNFENLLKPAFFQQGIQSLPREVSLPADGTLRIEPLRELAKLRHHRVVTQSIAVPPGAPRPAHDVYVRSASTLESLLDAESAARPKVGDLPQFHPPVGALRPFHAGALQRGHAAVCAARGLGAHRPVARAVW